MSLSSTLQELHLSSCNRVGMQTIRALATHCKVLTRLNLCELLEVTDEAVMLLANNCKRLEFLACQGCLSVSSLAMAEAARLLRMAQLAPSGFVLVPRSRIEISCLQIRQDENRAAKLLQDLVSSCARVRVTMCLLLPSRPWLIIMGVAWDYPPSSDCVAPSICAVFRVG